jgi:hypothetical protein
MRLIRTAISSFGRLKASVEASAWMNAISVIGVARWTLRTFGEL